MPWGEHHGHTSKLLVKTGDVVKRGQVIALVGATGNATGPHDHLEFPNFDPATKGWTYFPYGKTKEQVKALYGVPSQYYGNGLPFDGIRVTRGFLAYALYPKGYVYHPGDDLGKPQGTEIKAVRSGVVAYAGSNPGGWGNHLFIKWTGETNMSVRTELDKPALGKSKAMAFLNYEDSGEDINDYLNVDYAGKPLGDQPMTAFIDYMWKHPNRAKAMGVYKSQSETIKQQAAQIESLKKQLANSGNVDKTGIRDHANKILDLAK